MRMNLRRLCAIVVLLPIVASVNVSFGQTFTDHQYAEDVSNIPNPERGFYHHTETQPGSYSYLEESVLHGYRSQGITLILRLFYLTDFVSKPITDQYLTSMQQDFNTARAAGVKMIVRFAYTRKSSAPYGDATPEQVLKHIAQLKPLLKQNGDVISVIQAGFIGAWGEWYYTDHFSATLGNPTPADWENRRAVVNALLDAAPDSKAVQVRTPAIKFSLTESTEALTEAEAFTMTNKARLGHHNDCFLASADDYGTYTDMEVEKAFLEEETAYLPMGGETCGESVPLSECPNALAQMERFHWSFLNRDYHQGVLGSWDAGGCLPDVFQKLGYRFRLVNSALQQAAKPGGSVTFNINVVNDGWANPYNRRLVELVLRNKSTKKLLTFQSSEDPRKWTQTDTVSLSIVAGLPEDLEEGEYEVLLNLPDPEIALRNNPDYSIRLANAGTWEDETGYNTLNHTITVSKTADGAAYTGEDFFLSKLIVIEQPAIAIDGVAQEWEAISSLASSGPSHTLKVFNNQDSIYFFISGATDDSFEIFIDTDVDGSSGSLVQPWNSDYADYKINSNGISVFENGSWSIPVVVDIQKTGDVLEIGISRTNIETPSDLIAVAASVGSESAGIFMPSQHLRFAEYRLFLNSPEHIKNTSSGEKVILYWADNNTADANRVIERSTNDEAFKKIAVLGSDSFLYTDQLTDTNLSVRYRLYDISADGLNVSPFSTIISPELSEGPLFNLFSVDGNANDWKGVSPVATALYNDETQAYRVFMSAEKLFVLYEGIAPKQYAFYFDMDNSAATGAAENPWQFEGFDFVIRNDSLFDVRNTESFVMLVDREDSDGYAEYSVPLSVFDLDPENFVVNSAAEMIDGSETIYLPSITGSPAVYHRIAPSMTPQNIAVNNSVDHPDTQLSVTWKRCDGCSGYIIERSEQASEGFVAIATESKVTTAYDDKNLTAGVTYYYRVYSYNEAGPSLASETVSGTPNAVTGVEDGTTGISVYPNPVDDRLQLTLLPGTERIEVVNMQGKIVVRVATAHSASRVIIDVSALSRGIYVVRTFGTSHNILRILKR
jgi:hypothetical protein